MRGDRLDRLDCFKKKEWFLSFFKQSRRSRRSPLKPQSPRRDPLVLARRRSTTGSTYDRRRQASQRRKATTRGDDPRLGAPTTKGGRRLRGGRASGEGIFMLACSCVLKKQKKMCESIPCRDLKTATPKILCRHGQERSIAWEKHSPFDPLLQS